jgi:hypothetical protein
VQNYLPLSANVMMKGFVKFAGKRREIQPEQRGGEKISIPSLNTANMISINDKNHGDRRVMVVKKSILCQA